MTFIEKAKAWWKASGITNLGFIGGFAVGIFAGWPFIAGSCFGIFIYVNFNIIRKLIGKIGKSGQEGGSMS